MTVRDHLQAVGHRYHADFVALGVVVFGVALGFFADLVSIRWLSLVAVLIAGCGFVAGVVTTIRRLFLRSGGGHK